MKSRLSVAIVATIIIVFAIACKWFRNTTDKPVSIAGQWTIDSIASSGHDSTKDKALLAFALSGTNGKTLVEFGNDSTYRLIQTKDTLKGRYYVSTDAKSVFIEDDSVMRQYNFINRNDSAIAMLSTDSIFYSLKKR